MNKKCNKCQNKKPIGNFFKNKYSPDGFRSDCKNCRKEYCKKYSKTEKGKYLAIQKGAKDRNIEFNITLENYIENFFEKQCYYCDEGLKSTGIDRVNNNVGYIIGNMVPCCKQCNELKNNATIEDEKRIKLIIKKTEEHLKNEKQQQQ